MKLTLALAPLFIGSVLVSNLRAQGQILWGNHLPQTPTDPQLRAFIFGVDPNHPTEIRRGNTDLGLPPGTQTYAGPLLSGTGFTAAIYLGNDVASTMANNEPPAVNGTSSFR